MTSSPVPDWAKTTIYVGAGAFGGLNLIVSSISIGTLAYEHLDLDIVRSIALGLTPDAGALVAGTLWVACSGTLRDWGRSVSLGLVGTSVVGNAADVLASAGLVTPPVLVALAVTLAVAAPVLALLMGHLVLLVKAAPGAERVTKPVTRGKALAGEAVTTPVVVPTAPPPDESPEDRTRRLARERKARSRARTRQEAAA